MPYIDKVVAKDTSVFVPPTCSADGGLSGKAIHHFVVEGTVMPVIWKRRWDKGRIFYCLIGHRLEDLKVPDVTEIVKRGISWAAQKLDD
jgi:type 1 glutamine amidotransferase